MSNVITKIIGLTGPIGAGKDEVAKILRRRGAFIIDVDKVAHTLYSTQSEVWQEIVRVFGSNILNRGGAVNRKRLGEIVFSDKAKLRQLNKIIHPYLREAIILIAEDQKANNQRLIIINAAVLKEIGLVDYVDEVWVVMASKEKRFKRLLKSGLSKSEAEKRLRAQMSKKDYLKLADVVIDYNGALKGLKKKVLELIK